jgi:hypothetical protein
MGYAQIIPWVMSEFLTNALFSNVEEDGRRWKVEMRRKMSHGVVVTSLSSHVAHHSLSRFVLARICLDN